MDSLSRKSCSILPKLVTKSPTSSLLMLGKSGFKLPLATSAAIFCNRLSGALKLVANHADITKASKPILTTIKPNIFRV